LLRGFPVLGRSSLRAAVMPRAWPAGEAQRRIYSERLGTTGTPPKNDGRASIKT
jgi:hypothetical protein